MRVGADVGGTFTDVLLLEAGGRLRFTPHEAGSYFIQASGVGNSTGSYKVSIVRQ